MIQLLIFTKYKTIEYYGWAKESDKVLNGLDKVRIEDAFAKEFADRGLSLVKENGDLIVTLFVVVQQKTQQTANTTTMGGYYGGYYGYGPGWGWGPGHTTTTISEYNYKEGTLVCDVFDKQLKNLSVRVLPIKPLKRIRKSEKKQFRIPLLR